MSYKYSNDLCPKIGDIVKVERLGISFENVSVSFEPSGISNDKYLRSFISNPDDIPLTLFARITKLSAIGEIEQIQITKPPELVKFDDELLQNRFNTQFSVGELIDANQLMSLKLELSFWQRG